MKHRRNYSGSPYEISGFLGNLQKCGFLSFWKKKVVCIAEEKARGVIDGYF